MTQNKTKAIGKLSVPDVKNDAMAQEDMGANIYQVRHKMIHKAIRLPLDITQLRDFQLTAIEVLKRLCNLNRRITTKAEMIDHLESIHWTQ